MTDTDYEARVNKLLSAAVHGLDPADIAERIAYCRANNTHGVRMHTNADDDLIEFRWGGRRLVLVAAAALASDEPLAAGFVPEEIPDTVPSDWSADGR